jgi:hypothetical protein
MLQLIGHSMDTVFSIFAHSTRSSNHDVWRTGTRLAACYRLDRYYCQFYSGIRKLDTFNGKLHYFH